MKKSLFILLLICLSIQYIGAQSVIPPESFKGFDSFVKRQMSADKVPGLTIGVIKNGKTWVKGYGYSDLENKLPSKPESAYRLASITKPMTAIAILQLVEKGKIDLDAEVQKYVPYFPKKKHPVKVRHLLGHLGGISHYQNYAKEGHFKDHKNTREAIRVFENFDLVNKPGTRYRYTSYGYNLLGAVIEGASGISYGKYMRENVWKPLDMNATRMDDPNAIIPNRARGYRLVNGKVINSEFVDISSRFSAGGTRSTVIDLLKFADGMIKGKLLSDSTREKMWSSMQTDKGLYTYYGMGWGLGSSTGHFMVAHSGAQAETRTILYVFPKLGIAFAAAMNFESANPAVYAEKLYEAVTGNPWRFPIYAQNKRDVAPINAARLSFIYGMQHFERFGKPLTEDPGELKASFADFNRAVTFSGDEAVKAIRNGRNPSGNLTFVKMASFMASKLSADKRAFNSLFRDGPFSFFENYIRWYKTKKNYPKDYKFSTEFEKSVSSWNSDWAKTWNKETRNIEISTSTDFSVLRDKLKKSFSGAAVYPNYIRSLDNLIPNLATSGNFPKAIEVAEINHSLYPKSEITTGKLGIVYFVAGKNKEAKALLRQSNSINPNGTTSAENMNDVAYDLMGIGQTKAGLNILLAAIELNPKDANLLDSAGEFYLKLKQKEKAIAYYSRALKLNPDYPNAKNAKKILADLNR